jgi:DNA-binding LytR/AlgR family response regulator
MISLNCIAIEDEPNALQLLEHYAHQVPFLNWRGGFRQPMDALPLLGSHQVDLLFLDINLTPLDGISFYRSLTHKPKVIFTTAYPEYAVESYTLEALDYLVKPIQFDRFVLACNKALSASDQKMKEGVSEKKEVQGVLYLKSGTKWFHLQWSEIDYLEKDENYVVFHTHDGKKILSRQNMMDVEQIMPSYFHRIHKSYIVNLLKIEVIERDRVTVRKHALPLADSYREEFMKRAGIR